MVHLILYSKPGCHLCAGLVEKLNQIQDLLFELEIRDITTQDHWLNAYQYEIPVLKQLIKGQEMPIPRPSPRLSASQLATHLQKHLIGTPA
ncbi:glutaredoxin family protein [Synechococcus sp. PCC 6312]|uniref:glutaredoxin family protein n=1 Tax=Synechococcus sp. (strain ATCC 27167 / PCC 6312) TaxID=195253 RepID=UPI00059C4179|nr:glutaredoxin family protein [Synechococcus sp. PCC 6312]